MLTLSRKARIGFEILFFAIGLVLFWLVIRATGFSNILFQLRQAQLSAWPVFLIYPIVSLWDTAAWKLVFNPSWDEAIKIHELFVIRLAGEAVNNITPFLDIGGEPLKVYLVSKRFGVPASQAISAGLIAKTTLIASETVFILFGFGFFLFFIPLPYEWRIIFGITFFFLAVILALLFLIQIKSDMTRSFYSTEKKRLWDAFSLNLASWVLGSVETYFFFRILGASLSFDQAILIEATVQFVRVASFFIPGNLGAQESGLAFFSQVLGLGAPAGIAVSLLKRLRQVIWTAVGFGIWGFYQSWFYSRRSVIS